MISWRTMLAAKATEHNTLLLTNWLTHTPPALVAQHLNLDAATIARFLNNKPEVMPL